MPSITAPWPWLVALLGLTIWLPMSPATHTLFTFTRLMVVDAHLGDVGEVAAVAVLERHAHRRALRQLPLAPARSFAHGLEHAARAPASKPSPPCAGPA